MSAADIKGLDGELECENCGKLFDETPETESLAIANLQFCSEDCLDSYVTRDEPDEDEEFEDEDEDED